MSIAASPVEDGAEPPDWPNTLVPAAMPDATSDTRMLSMLVWVRAVSVNALLKLPPFILSKALAGKLVRLVQNRQASLKLVPADVSMSGKLVRLEQLYQVNLKVVPADVSIRGKLVRLLQSYHARSKSVPEDVSIRGKLVRPVQSRHAVLKSVPADVSIRGKLVISDHSRQ